MGLFAEALFETLWPTRCALCDRPGTVLCEQCRQQLDVLDQWRACPQCGAAFGLVQCDHCTPIVSKESRIELCVSALRYTDNTGALIKTFKDKGEQRLAEHLSQLLADALPPSWISWAHAITYVTATTAAKRRRGFDHMELVARQLAKLCDKDCLRTLNEPLAKDQRILGRAERRANMKGRFSTCCDTSGMRLVLIDDVFTTGATITEAREALEAAGAHVRCATVARA